MKKGIVYLFGLELLISTLFVKSSSLTVAYFFYSISLFFLGILRNYISFQLPLLFLFILIAENYTPQVCEWNHSENQFRISFSLQLAPLAFLYSTITRINDHIFLRLPDSIFARDKPALHHPHPGEGEFAWAADWYISALIYHTFQVRLDDF